MMKIPAAWLLCALLGLSVAQAQTLWQDTLRGHTGDTIRLSHHLIAPLSDTLRDEQGRIVGREAYTLNPFAGWIVLHTARSDTTFRIRYRFFPGEKISLRTYEPPRDTGRQDLPTDYVEELAPQPESDAFWEDSEGISKSGSLTRGITGGNNRSLSVNSGLRLQLEGDLGDGLTITGNITDENVPLQPDGSTQQLSDFDRVFIRLAKGPLSVTIGDYEAEQKQSRFASYYRNVQGLKLGYKTQNSDISVSGAVAKGKFHSNSFPGLDGVAGPYRLTGRNGERFFIVLAGSERVYLNGKLMQRGENLDYIINYNTAEVTFTSRHVITNVTRIVIDFEYNDRYFNRSLLLVNAGQKVAGGKVQLRFTYARDGDNPNAPFDDPEAYNAIRDSLRAAGDDPRLAITSGVTEVGYSQTELRYERRDTLIAGQNYERYIRSRNPSLAVYSIRFSFVGEGNGFYRPDPGDNENVYRWVAPDPDGRPAGSYMPVRQWSLPRLLQVADLQADIQLAPKWKISTETAFSSDDANRLSNLDEDDNTGMANRIALQWAPIRLGDSLAFSGEVSHQFVSRRYTTLDRLYRAEYGRVWNFDESDEVRRDEQVIQGQARLNIRNNIDITAEGGLRYTGPGRVALRQVYSLSSSLPKFLQGNFTLTRIQARTDSIRRVSQWNRYEGDIFAPLGKLQPGVVIWMENKTETRADSLRAGSFAFTDLKPYLRTRGTKALQSELSLNYRFDREWLDGLMRDKSEAWTATWQISYRPRPNINLQNTTSWRRLDVRDSAFAATGLDNARTLNANLQATLSDKKRIIYTNLVYEASAEQVARREIRYIEVNPGQGEYVWLDSLYNNDGIQDIEEFQLANNPLTANFLRIVAPTRELFPATRLSATGNLVIDLRKALPESKNPWREILRNFRSVSNLRLTQNRNRGENTVYLINFFNPLGDTSLLDASYSLRQDFGFFQNSPTGDLRFSFADIQSRLFLTTGDELRRNQGITFSQRLNLSDARSLEADTRLGQKSTFAELFPARNFDIRSIETKPRINFQFNRKLRLTAGYEYLFRQNRLPDGNPDAFVHIHKLVADARWNIRDRNNIFTRLELVHLRQSGSPGFSAEYELREGLQPGANAIIRIFATWYVLSNVELSATYEGRITGKTPPIHTGRLQVRALF